MITCEERDIPILAALSSDLMKQSISQAHYAHQAQTGELAYMCINLAQVWLTQMRQLEALSESHKAIKQ